MSKSYGNFIDVFAPEKQLRKTIMGIKTDSTPLEEPKNPEGDTVFTLYQLLASAEESRELENLYRGGNFGYGQAKQMLFEKVMEVFSGPREQYAALTADSAALDSILFEGAERAREKAVQVLGRVKKLCGFA